MQYGIDYLGAGGSEQYQRMICRNHPKGWAAGFLVRASGWRSGLRAAKRLAASDRCPPIIRFHGIWLDSHLFTSRHIKPAVQIARRVARFAEANPQVKVYYSPWLEPIYVSQELMTTCKRRCKEVLPKCVEFVQGRSLPSGINEVHGGTPVLPRYIFSMDGEETNKTPGYNKLHTNCEIFFLWMPECNGKAYLKEKTPRSQRTHYLKPRHIAYMKGLVK